MQDLIQSSGNEESFGVAVRGTGTVVYERNNITDFNDYKPVQIFPLSERPVAIISINHDLGREILGIQFEHRVAIYQLEIVRDLKDEYVTLRKLQKFATMPSGQKLPKFISSFSINSTSNLSPFGERNLTYAFSYEGDCRIYFVSEYVQGQAPFTEVKTTVSEDVTILNGHNDAVRHLAFDAERGELLASLSDDSVCVVWAVATKQQVSCFSLQSPGVACLWHKAEPYKLLIVEQAGLIRMYNTLKRCPILTINTLVQPIYSADWSQSDSQLVGLGTNKCAYIFDLSLLNSEPGKRIETHFGATHCIKFSSTDSQQFSTATMSPPKAEIKTFQKNFKNVVWSQNHESIQGINWIYGEPLLMALTGKQLIIYESVLV